MLELHNENGITLAQCTDVDRETPCDKVISFTSIFTDDENLLHGYNITIK